MKYFLAIIGFCLGLFIILYLVSVLWESYKWLRRKLNKPLIGFVNFNGRLMKRDDYVSIDGEVLCFSHIASEGQTINPLYPALEKNKTVGGEVAFRNPNELGYLYYNPSTLKHCEFIYGKYGVKWAASEHWASVAKEKVEEYIYS